MKGSIMQPLNVSPYIKTVQPAGSVTAVAVYIELSSTTTLYGVAYVPIADDNDAAIAMVRSSFQQLRPDLATALAAATAATNPLGYMPLVDQWPVTLGPIPAGV
jgi:hypothetical protein